MTDTMIAAGLFLIVVVLFLFDTGPGGSGPPHRNPPPFTFWRTIDSAPKDGTVVLLREPGSTGTHRGFYMANCWWVEDRDALDLWPSKPTHWMPLP
jgi:hypothetical protein